MVGCKICNDPTWNVINFYRESLKQVPICDCCINHIWITNSYVMHQRAVAEMLTREQQRNEQPANNHS
jgi:hypothetical protein